MVEREFFRLWGLSQADEPRMSNFSAEKYATPETIKFPFYIIANYVKIMKCQS